MKKLKVILPVFFVLGLLMTHFPLFANTSPGTAAADSLKPRTGDFVTLDLRYNATINGKDSLLFDTKQQKDAKPTKFKLPPSDFKGDLYESIMTLSPGDSNVFKINADSLFMKTFKMVKLPEGMASGSFLTFHVRLLKVENPDKLKSTEAGALKKYLADNHVTVSPTSTGVYIIEQAKGEGLKIDSGNMVKLHFSVALVDGTPLFSSYDRPEPLKFQYGKRFDTPGFDEAIGKMRAGTKAMVIVPSAVGFAEKGQGNIVPPYSTLVYTVEILEVQAKTDYEKEQAEKKLKDDQMKENDKKNEASLLQKYLDDNKIKVKPTASGLYFIEKIKGTGEQAVAGKTVSVHYTGTLLDGKKFDSSVDRNEPFEFMLGQGQVIKGWDEGIALMKVGGKATLLIPSSIAYGDRDMGVIPPYSSLVFDVELLGVK